MVHKLSKYQERRTKTMVELLYHEYDSEIGSKLNFRVKIQFTAKYSILYVYRIPKYVSNTISPIKTNITLTPKISITGVDASVASVIFLFQQVGAGTDPTFTYLKSAVSTSEQYVKYVQSRQLNINDVVVVSFLLFSGIFYLILFIFGK